MSRPEPLEIRSKSLPEVWAKAFNTLMEHGTTCISPLTVIVDGLDTKECVIDDKPTVDAIDEMFEALELNRTVQTTANTIFPWNAWNREMPPDHLFNRYRKPSIQKKIRSCAGNRPGHYFLRMIGWGNDGQGFNQLEHILETYGKGNKRVPALQLALMDPLLDHTHQRQRGFPCLQQISFNRLGDNEFVVTAFYPRQYIFERAYGNYLGLIRLGHFVEKYTGMKLVRMVCIAGQAELGDVSKERLQPLHKKLNSSFDQQAVQEEVE